MQRCPSGPSQVSIDRASQIYCVSVAISAVMGPNTQPHRIEYSAGRLVKMCGPAGSQAEMASTEDHPSAHAARSRPMCGRQQSSMVNKLFNIRLTTSTAGKSSLEKRIAMYGAPPFCHTPAGCGNLGIECVQLGGRQTKPFDTPHSLGKSGTLDQIGSTTMMSS